MSIANNTMVENDNITQEEITHQIRSEELKMNPSESAPASTTATAVAEEPSKASEESSLAQPDIPNKKLCGICKENESKYRCSRCYLP
jgi:hypothetical protein